MYKYIHDRLRSHSTVWENVVHRRSTNGSRGWCKCWRNYWSKLFICIHIYVCSNVMYCAHTCVYTYIAITKLQLGLQWIPLFDVRIFEYLNKQILNYLLALNMWLGLQKSTIWAQKNHRFLSFLLYHNLITIYTTTTKSSSLLQNLMCIFLQLAEMGHCVLNGRY